MRLCIILFVLTLTSCQPQTESREHMDLTSDRMSDSILKLIDSSLALPGKVLAGTGSPIASSASSFTPASLPK
jgi:hypothetical protein